MTAAGLRRRPRLLAEMADCCRQAALKKSRETSSRVRNRTRIRAFRLCQDQMRGRMSKAEAYRQNAGKCLEMADKTSDIPIRLGLIDMAHVWLRLAEQAEKNSHLDLVYETPPSASRRMPHQDPSADL